MVNKDTLYWFVKYITSKNIIPHSDCDIISFNSKLGDGKFKISNIKVRKTYGNGKLSLNYSTYIEYSINDFELLADKKYVSIFKESDNIRIVYLASNEDIKVKFENNTYFLLPNISIDNIEDYRLNVINFGNKFSYKNNDIASYLGIYLYKILKALGTDSFSLSEYIDGDLNILFNNHSIRILRSKVEEYAMMGNKNDDKLENLLANLLIAMGKLPKKVDNLNIGMNGKGIKTVSFWSRRSKVILDIYGFEKDVELSRRGL